MVKPIHPDKLITLKHLGQSRPAVKSPSYNIGKARSVPASSTDGAVPDRSGLIDRLAYKLHQAHEEQYRRG